MSLAHDSSVTPTTSLPQRAAANDQGPTSQKTLLTLYNTASTYIDHYIPPSTRTTIQQNLSAFTTSHPYLASFLIAQLSLSLPPLLIFIISTTLTIIFSVITGIMIGLLGAMLFIMCVVGVSLIILIPTLLFTTVGVVVLWFWGLVGYTALRWYTGKPLILPVSDDKAVFAKESPQKNQRAVVEDDQTGLGSFSDVDCPKAFDEQVRARMVKTKAVEEPSEPAGDDEADFDAIEAEMAAAEAEEERRELEYARKKPAEKETSRKKEEEEAAAYDADMRDNEGKAMERSDVDKNKTDWQHTFNNEVHAGMETNAAYEARKERLFNVQRSPHDAVEPQEPPTPTPAPSQGTKGKHLIITSTSPEERQKKHTPSSSINSNIIAPLRPTSNGVATSSTRTSNEL